MRTHSVIALWMSLAAVPLMSAESDRKAAAAVERAIAATATLMGRLVDRGKLKWTSRLDEMLPGLAAGMQPEYRDVRLIELLSHFSGLPGDLLDEACDGTRIFQSGDDIREACA